LVTVFLGPTAFFLQLIIMLAGAMPQKLHPEEWLR
jgi:hypothetical protein